MPTQPISAHAQRVQSLKPHSDCAPLNAAASVSVVYHPYWRVLVETVMQTQELTEADFSAAISGPDLISMLDGWNPAGAAILFTPERGVGEARTPRMIEKNAAETAFIFVGGEHGGFWYWEL